MQFKRIATVLLITVLLFALGSVAVMAESESSDIPSSTQSSTQSDTSSENVSSGTDLSSEQSGSSDTSSEVGSSSISVGSSSAVADSSTTHIQSSSRPSTPNVGGYTDNPDTGSDLSMASGDDTSGMTQKPTSSVQKKAGKKSIDTGLISKWVFIPILLAILSIAGLVYVNYSAYMNKKALAQHQDFDLSSVQTSRQRTRGRRSGRNRRL